MAVRHSTHTTPNATYAVEIQYLRALSTACSVLLFNSTMVESVQVRRSHQQVRNTPTK